MWKVITFITRTNFEGRCKSALSRTKHRLDVVKKKRNETQRSLKEGIADLLKSNLERDAYGKAEELYVEITLASCYDYVEEYLSLIAEHINKMHRQSECPEECKVAVASLIDATASCADLPDLRDLRLQFYNKYSIALQPYANKEFLDKLNSKPTMEVTLKLMQHIANEFSVIWDPESLEKQLQNESMSTNDNDGDDEKNVNADMNKIDEKKDDEDNNKINEEKDNEENEKIDEKKDNEDNNKIDENCKIMTRHTISHSQSWCTDIDDKQDEAVFELPLPPGRRRYLFPESGTSSMLLKENDSNAISELPFNHCKSKFVPPNFDEPKKTKSKHRKSVSYGNDDSYGLGYGKFPDLNELAERVLAHRKTQGA